MPYSKKDGYGYGQSNIWYADDNDSKKFRNYIIEKIDSIIKNYVCESKNDEEKYYEGEMKTRVKEVNSIKRNVYARKKCLEHYFPDKNYRCILCDFNFKEKYGSYGEGFIEVHHIESHTVQSKVKGKHEVNPIKDLIPICSNCHSIIHKGKKMLSIEKMRKILS